jgi:hypothetical protein
VEERLDGGYVSAGDTPRNPWYSTVAADRVSAAISSLTRIGVFRTLRVAVVVPPRMPQWGGYATSDAFF